MPSIFVSNSTEETQKWGSSFARQLKKNDVVALYGPLGSGKTTLVRAIITTLTDQTQYEPTSPTFVYLNEYEGRDQVLYHFDLYRLRERDDFVECGFEEYFFQGGICLIEWAERIEEILPKNSIRLWLKHSTLSTREIITTKGVLIQ